MGQFNFGAINGWHIVTAVVLITVWVSLIKLVFFAIRSSREWGKKEKEPQNRPLDILKERYAKGEIDKEEFEKRRMDLSEA